MKRLALISGGVVLAAVLGVAAYIWFSGGSGEPSTELTTPALSDTTAPETTTTGGTAGSTPDTSADPTTISTSTTSPEAGGAFVIDPDQSEARFELEEELRGSPNEVVGTTREVAGQVRFDPSDLSSVELSEVVVNARTFQTGSSSRDRAIRSGVILDSGSDEHELITFNPDSIEGLPEQADRGDTVSATVTGELTIKGTTQTETFDLEVTWVDETTLEGTASATVDRTDYGIGIPDVPTVASVDEEVRLVLEFVAAAS
ncbi:MAG: YceI family protein [Actinomycetota bacterium]